MDDCSLSSSSVSSVGNQRVRFFIEGVGYRAFRRPAVTTTRAVSGLIKAGQRQPRGGERTGKKRRTKEQKKETQKNRKKDSTQSKNRDKRKQKTQKTNVNITVFLIASCKSEKEEPKQKVVTFIITETKGKTEGKVIRRRE